MALKVFNDRKKHFDRRCNAAIYLRISEFTPSTVNVAICHGRKNVLQNTVPADNYNDIAQATTPEVEVIGMAQDESGALVAGIRVDGQEALIVDLDANNVADVIVSDLNGDGYISDSEIGFITDGGIYMSDLAAMQNSQDLAMGPDYVNNADTNIYEA